MADGTKVVVHFVGRGVRTDPEPHLDLILILMEMHQPTQIM
jgi:hypothetical protein